MNTSRLIYTALFLKLIIFNNIGSSGLKYHSWFKFYNLTLKIQSLFLQLQPRIKFYK